MTRVVGIDPSLSATGWAHNLGGYTLSGTITTKPDDPRRLVVLDVGICDQALTHGHGSQRLDLAVVEDLPTHAKSAGLTGMAQGVVRLALQTERIPYLLVTPATLKKFATGKGNATKADMRMSLYQRGGLDIRDDNQVDAIWLYHLGRHFLGDPAIDLPKTHLAALAGLGDVIRP